MTRYEIIEFIGKHKWLSTRQLQWLNYGVRKDHLIGFFNPANLYRNLNLLIKEGLVAKK
jgi:hypothetical protein